MKIQQTNNKKSLGFTLIELMIVVAIIGIITGIALPSYQEHLKSGRRTDATAMMSGFAQAMEKHFTEHSTYTSAISGSAPDAPIASVYYSQTPADGSTKYYDLKVHAVSNTTYTLRAIPIGSQAGDGFLELTSTGIRRWDKNDSASALDAGENCWRKNC